ncbi:MAG: rhodanese-like domain-containing protein, partial [Sphaerobacter sp.]|nr:rhodanese-like domain-containing protein [Sphaerobacter sp.]
REGLRITAITETHIHADFVSGARELARRTGARLYLSDEGPAEWKYAYAAEAGAALVRHGDSFMVGNVRIDVVHTPGHTPEHISFLVTDTAAADKPMGIFTGDFVFVGDIGRPDLLEEAAGIRGTKVPGARQLFKSLQRFKELPDYVQIWPGHGAGSACGKALGAVPQSTVGYERLFNWAFQITGEDEFVEAVLSGQPEPPKYFAEMKRVNKIGPAMVRELRPPRSLAGRDLPGVIESGAIVVDTRAAAAYATGFIPGTLNIPLDNAFVTWAGWLIPYDVDIYLLVDEECPQCAATAVRGLRLIGLDRVGGIVGAREALTAWTEMGRGVETYRAVTAAELDQMRQAETVAVIDVRGRVEWEAGHLPGVRNIPLGYLADRLDELVSETPTVVCCQTGARSAIAVSLLRAKGLTNISHLAGGFAAWAAEGRPVARAAGRVGAA